MTVKEFIQSLKDRTYLGTLILLAIVLLSSIAWIVSAALGYNPFYELYKYLIR